MKQAPVASAPAATPVATTPVEPPPRRSLVAWSKVRENLEAVLVAIVLALIIRHFSLEAFEIPTGSMAPGLYGVHLDSECPNCGTESAVSIAVDQHSGAVTEKFDPGYHYVGTCSQCGGPVEDRLDGPNGDPHCERCGDEYPQSDAGSLKERAKLAEFDTTCHLCGFDYREVYTPSDPLAGHKILVNKFIYKIREPRRWEVIVFKFNRQRNYIKRLIGLPGEQIQVVGGDIHIDGSIERKPIWAQDALWYPVHDSALRERLEPAEPAWRMDTGWSRDGETPEARFDLADGAEARLVYDRTIYHRCQYNDSGGPRRSESEARARDLRLLANLEIANGDGEVALAVKNGKQNFEAWLPAGPDATGRPATFRYWETHPDERVVLAEIPAGGLALHEVHAVDFYLADRQLVLRVDGTVRMELPLPDRVIEQYRNEESTVRVHARAAEGGRLSGRVTRLQVFRDLHYTSTGDSLFRNAVEEPFQLGPDEFFAMGDNSSRSQDSRVWGKVDRENLLGRAFCIFWPALPFWRWEAGFIR